MRIFAFVLAFVSLIVPAAADPNDFSRTIAFGDSLSDNGNLANNIPPSPSAPFLPGYFDGRFSNGPTWIELLSDPSKSTNPDNSMNRFWGGSFFGLPYDVGGNVDNVNAAIGGAQTVAGFPPSVQAQIGAFVSAGGVFGPNDLVSVQGGANDFFAFFTANPTPTALQLQTFATVTGLNEAGNVALVAGAGAKTILVSNLPNIGATPSFNGNPLTAGGGLLATATYNAALNQATQQLATDNPGVNFVQMDWFSALNVVIANPAAFGFTNVTAACILDPNCAGKPLSVQNQFLFWDTVHPTEAGHEFLAQYAALLLSTEQTGQAVAALGQVALTTRLEASDIIFRRAFAPARQGPGGLYAEIIGETGSFDGTDTILGNTGADYSLAGVRAGFDAGEGPVSFGASLAYQGGDINGHLLDANLRSSQIDAYLLRRYAALFAGLEGGVSFNEFHDIKRGTGFPTINADGSTNSIDYTLAATLGAQYQLSGLTLTPAVRVGYASLNLDKFTESAPILALQYGDRDVTTGFWTARLRASTPFYGATVYGEVGYEDLFSTDDAYTAKLASNTAHAVTINDDLEARGLYLKAGIGGVIGDNIKLSGEYGLSLQNGDGEVHSGRLRVTIPLSSEAPLGD